MFGTWGRVANQRSQIFELFEDVFGFANELGNRFFVQIGSVQALADLDLAVNPHHDGDVGFRVQLVTIWTLGTRIGGQWHLADLVLFGSSGQSRSGLFWGFGHQDDESSHLLIAILRDNVIEFLRQLCDFFCHFLGEDADNWLVAIAASVAQFIAIFVWSRDVFDVEWGNAFSLFKTRLNFGGDDKSCRNGQHGCKCCETLLHR